MSRNNFLLPSPFFSSSKIRGKDILIGAVVSGGLYLVGYGAKYLCSALGKTLTSDNKTDNDIRKAQALSDIRINERIKMQQLFKEHQTELEVNDSQEINLREWISYFHSHYTMPDYSAIPFLAAILDGCPDGYEEAILMSLLTETGALCFSKVRARYLDNVFHSPSLQTIVEGKHGSGKAKILHLHNCLFEHIIKDDSWKLTFEDGKDLIIQTAGINISQAKFYQVMAYNRGVHICALETETSSVINTFKKQNGLSFDYLRKAFHNECVYQNNKAKGAPCGSFPVYFNYIFTGTPESINELIDKTEVEGGTASRICFAVIPEVERVAPTMSLPSGAELQEMRKQISTWRALYCFKKVDSIDVPCPETIIDLGYICEAIESWLNKQYDTFLKDGVRERNEDRHRMATIAFHSAIVLHMLAGNPQPNDRKLRKTVRELTIYIADYCMERFIAKFSKSRAHQFCTNPENAASSSIPSTPVHRQLTDEEILDWYPKHGTCDKDGNKIGYGTIASELGVDKDSVRNSFKRYEKQFSTQ